MGSPGVGTGPADGGWNKYGKHDDLSTLHDDHERSRRNWRTVREAVTGSLLVRARSQNSAGSRQSSSPRTPRIDIRQRRQSPRQQELGASSQQFDEEQSGDRFERPVPLRKSGRLRQREIADLANDDVPIPPKPPASDTDALLRWHRAVARLRNSRPSTKQDRGRIVIDLKADGSPARAFVDLTELSPVALGRDGR